MAVRLVREGEEEDGVGTLNPIKLSKEGPAEEVTRDTLILLSLSCFLSYSILLISSC